jgi:hypothetical protein
VLRDVTVNPNVAQPALDIPLNFTNQHFGAPQILGYPFWWDHTYVLDSNIIGHHLYYIQHARHRQHNLYLNPHPGVPQQMVVDRLMWGVQMSLFLEKLQFRM